MFGSEKVRGIAYQVLLLALVVLLGWYLVSNTLHNLSTRQIQVGFGFLVKEAGFEVSESLIEYDASRSYGRAFLVGLANTLVVAVLGIVLATVLGTLIGISRLSNNWLLAKLAGWYVEVMRNIPLLLQLFVWYGVFTELLPPVREAIQFGDSLFISQRGFRFAWPAAHGGWTAAGVGLLLALLVSFIYARFVKRRQQQTGQRWPLAAPALAAFIGLPMLGWLVGGAPTAIDWPKLEGFDYQGGKVISPEFMALLIGLVTYTAAFIAEVVRAGIQAVDKGQGEAASALGLSSNQQLSLITLPQALRVIIPPMTSQYLNLTKNSSLAVAIGYPDLVAVANTTMNQTGQAIEAIAIIMAVYLSISLLISAAMNAYNARMRLKER